MSAEGVLALPTAFDERVAAGRTPWEAAVSAARSGTEGGTFLWAPPPPGAERLEAAVVLAPEEPAAAARTVVFAAQQALTDTLGALGPPQTAVMWAYPDVMILNGAIAGRLRLTEPEPEPEPEPGPEQGAAPAWLVLDLTLRLSRAETGEADRAALRSETSFAEEGLAGLAPEQLLGSWARHFLRWLHVRETEGLRPVAEAWLGRAVGRGGDVAVTWGDERFTAQFLGLDEEGGLLLSSSPKGGPVALGDALRRDAGGGRDALAVAPVVAAAPSALSSEDAT